MNIKEIKIKNFKSLYNVSFCPGNINVFIGANGSGKSSVLEAIGVLSAAMTDRVNNNSLQRKGVRLSTSSLYKSQFRSIERNMPTVDFSIDWERNQNQYDYSVHLTTPTDNDTWKYHSESVSKNGEVVFGRSNRTSMQLNNKVGYYALSEKLTGEEYTDMGNYISRYGIYQPDTLTLRGNVADSTQVTPIGLNGGRLADTMEDLFTIVDDETMFGTMSMDDVLELIEWASDIHITKPKKSNLNPGVPSTRQVIEFQDRFLKDKSVFTGYDASEGALYILFMLTLAMHPDVPKMFAIDSFDHALNPRLAKRITEIFSQLIIESGKTVFMTTHNPLVLDGLNLADDRIRLFAINKNRYGHAELNRIQISPELLETGQSLSRLWINGLLGGVPELL
ncbi:MAG: AAA family ATPase [Lachnospiraceae bacterium]|nr:AAA family ATPase [Lachnospiraceae bacterium]